jgi:Na+/H+ antiporter NhaD/arsenite permease-like protein
MLNLLTIIFILGYVAIALEQQIRLDKAASALLTGVLCWTVYKAAGAGGAQTAHTIAEHMGEISQILFFLLGAMVTVELIDAHDGFEIITERIRTRNKQHLLLWTTALTFFLSAILDNLTTTIVMVSLLRKLVEAREDRLLLVGMVVVAANAGGAWSPMGDVTTTMLWIGKQITPANIIARLFLPSVVCVLVPLAIFYPQMKGTLPATLSGSEVGKRTAPREQRWVLFTGILVLLFVPVFKSLTHLPPFMGMLLGLGVMWMIIEWMHAGKDEMEKGERSVAHALRKVDSPSILFFLGILLAVAALQSAEILPAIASALDRALGDISLTVILIGFLSAVVDNVPLVAAVQGMYPLSTFPTDHYFWEFLAYCAGTGGSTLLIGSAAGVAAMGLERISFFWYLRRITLPAASGYLSGALIYMLLDKLLHG